jgi:hypothetical protein
MKTLPRELWYYILKIKSAQAWECRKNFIHQVLEKSVVPLDHHSREFVFREYRVTYFRTENLEICVEDRGRSLQIHLTLNVNLGLVDGNILRTRFVCCPVYIRR